MSLFVLGIVSKCFGLVGSPERKNWSGFLSSKILCYLILGVFSSKKKFFSLNLYQAKSGVISFCVGGFFRPKKKFSVHLYVKTNLMFFFGGVGGSCK